MGNIKVRQHFRYPADAFEYPTVLRRPTATVSNMDMMHIETDKNT